MTIHIRQICTIDTPTINKPGQITLREAMEKVCELMDEIQPA
jgi:hypothetical protein